MGHVSGDVSLYCQGCRLDKQVQLPYPTSDSVSQRPFDLVHSDMWGMAPFTLKGGHRYYIIFIDDFSRYTWLYFITSVLRPWFTLSYLRLFACSVLIRLASIRQDVAWFLSEQGTLAQFSCPSAHAQNGVA
jgi:hypothetical protein